MTTTDTATDKLDVARTHTQEATQDAKARATEVGSHAQGAAHDVTSTAVDQAHEVKDETLRQARNVASDAAQQLSSQASEQTQRISANLRDLGHELRQMADAGNGGTATELAHQASDRAHQVAGYLDGREPGQILDDLRSLARRRPGAFLAGAAALGLLAGRVGRGVKDADPAVAPAVSEPSTATEGSPISSATPMTAPPGESLDNSEATPIVLHDDDLTVDLTDDYRSALVEPVRDWEERR